MGQKQKKKSKRGIKPQRDPASEDSPQEDQRLRSEVGDVLSQLGLVGNGVKGKNHRQDGKEKKQKAASSAAPSGNGRVKPKPRQAENKKVPPHPGSSVANGATGKEKKEQQSRVKQQQKGEIGAGKTQPSINSKKEEDKPTQAANGGKHMPFDDGGALSSKQKPRTSALPKGQAGKTGEGEGGAQGPAYLLEKEVEDGVRWYTIKTRLLPAAAATPTEGEKDKKKKMHPKQLERERKRKEKLDSALEKQKNEAEGVYTTELERYEKSKRARMNNDDRMLLQMLRSGTLSDKIAALTLLVQESPVHRLQYLQQLTSMGWSKGRRESQMALEALSDLYLNNILPDRKLRFLKDQPLLQGEEADGQKVREGENAAGPSYKKQLVLFYFENAVKQAFAQFVAILERGMGDNLEHYKRTCMNIAFELLKSKPEQEKALLLLLVNKLGDPERKISSKAVFLLQQLMTEHPAMKRVVVTEVEQFLLRPNLSGRAEYCAVICLNQIFLSEMDQELARHLIALYFRLFERYIASGDETKNGRDSKERKGKRMGKNNKKGGKQIEEKEDKELTNHSRMLSALLTGVNRAFPYAETQGEEFESHVSTLFRLVHRAPFSTAVQGLMLLLQVTNATRFISERFYRALYAKLLDPALGESSKHTLFLNLLYRSMKADTSIERVEAFAKRLLQVSLHLKASFAAASLVLLSEIFKVKPGIKSLFSGPKERQLEEAADNRGPDKDEERATTTSEPDAMSDKEDGEQALVETKDGDNKKEGTGKDEGTEYDPKKREPLFAHAETSCMWELGELAQHYHPSVQQFALSLLSPPHEISYKGDPLQDFSLIAFLDRFSYKNPKSKDVPKKGMGAAKPKGQEPVNSNAFLEKTEGQIEHSERFFYKFFKDKKELERRKRPAETKRKDDNQDLDVLEDVSDTEYQERSEKLKSGDYNFSDEEDSEYEAFARKLAEDLMQEGNHDDEDVDFGDLTSDEEEGDGEKSPAEEGEDDEEEEDDGDLGSFGEESDDDSEVGLISMGGKKGLRSGDEEAMMFGDDGSESSDAEGMEEEEDGFPSFAAGQDDDSDLEETEGFDAADSEEEEEDREEKGRKGKKSAQTSTGKRKSASVFADASEFEEILAKAGSEDANVKQMRWEERHTKGRGGQGQRTKKKLKR